MTYKIAILALTVLAFPLSALAQGGAASPVTNAIAGLSEASTLGLLGSGLVGFAIFVRRRRKAV